MATQPKSVPFQRLPQRSSVVRSWTTPGSRGFWDVENVNLVTLRNKRNGDFVGDEEGQLAEGEKPGNDPEEAKLQSASKQIVQNAILQAMQQVSQESGRREGRPSDGRPRCPLGGRELPKKHGKK
ncbi:A-kinase anchor protein inhibitor 1 [Perognathus longimembris pacificus]|uniref:A-kinase anchor protein inhibitor 1 n=1 Tax=Perognathus longimembris pacificus TaxID=214514 RepID=UPI002019A5C8|nr:A-kinase anchor protein inhibitor 1 [Perognathus longimembris pacificus]